MPPPKEMIQKLCWWSEARLEITLHNLGDIIPHGVQDNWTDCGIIAANTAFRLIVNDEPIWMSENRCSERIRWFLILLRRHVLDVSDEYDFKSSS